MSLGQNSPTPDATTGAKGKVQLAGDLGGTAAAPVVGAAKITPGKLATGAASASVATSQTTASTSYTDLATSGPAVTVTIGANGLALVSIYSIQANSGANYNNASFAVSGANTIAAADGFAFANNGTLFVAGGATFLLTGLAAGSTTFTMKYDVNGGTGTFQSRKIAVVPL